MEHITFPLDHFGVVSAPIFAELLAQAGDKRKRRTAFRAIEQMLTKFKLIPKGVEVRYIGQLTDEAGQTTYSVLFITPSSEAAHASYPTA